MREMILRTVLLCLGTVLAAPHLPQTINCPNSDIHVFVNQSAVDRTEYTFVDWNAANLQDCVEKCFGNHFCYSIRFDAALDHNCALYYFAAYNCSNQALTKASTIEYKGGSITLDCIRCPGRGEFVTAPPFSSVGEQTIVSETAVLARGKNIKGTATEITHNSEHEGKTHGEAEADKDKLNAEGKTPEEGKEGSKGEVEGSGEKNPTENVPSDAEKTGEGATGAEPSASTETTLTGQEPSDAEGSTAVPSAESSDATTASPEESAGATVVPGTEGSTAAPEAGSTPAGSEDEAGSTVVPESGSTPSDESSTVEGSGEAEEATSPITGESNGEAEFIAEASGEGAPTSTGPPGTAPPHDVEGSGVEGSGTAPEIAGQEEEEPVKVEVETTTVWNGHTEQPRECSGNLRFVPSSIVDLDTVQLLINSTKANSPAECAKICYEHNCGFAYYEPSTFICQFMANTEDLVDSSTCPADVKDAKYQAEFRTDVASTLTCVTCAKDSELDLSKPVLRPVESPRRGSYPACIISFQAAEGDHSSFPFYKSTQVHGLNECARHCFVGECSQSVYNPNTKECRLGSNPKDTCNNLPLIQKVAPAPSEEVLLQCFRCIPEDLIGVKGTVSETTGYREPPTAAESIDEAAATANKEKEQAAVAPTTQEPATEAPTTEAAEPETTTTVAAATTETVTEAPTTAAAAIEETTTTPVTPTEAATEAHTTVAAEPETTTTTAPTTEAAATEIPSTEPPTTEAVPEETTATSESATTDLPTTEASVTTANTTDAEPEETTIAGSGAEVDLTEPLPEGVTEKPEEETIASNATETTTAEEIETTPIGGAEVELEEASGEEATTSSSAESGTSSTGYDNESTTATNGETEAAEGHDGEQKATTTVEAAEGSGEEGASTVAPSGESKDDGSATAAGKEGEEAAATTPNGEEATSEGGEETTVGGEEGTTAAGTEGSSTLTSEEGATSEAGAESSTLSPEDAATSEGPGEMSKAIEANDQPLILASEDLDFGKSCVIKFQAAPFASRPSTMVAPFEKTFSVDSIELCATRCFQDGCTSAKYEPETRTCHLAYNDKSFCDRSELHLRMKDVEGETWIHCVNCYPEKSVVKDVLGAPLNKNTTGEEKEGEGKSMLDKVIGAVSGVAHSVAETVTGENPDSVLRHGCIVNFQTSPSTEMGEAVEYLPPFKTRYAHRCATKCFQEGCAAASFNPTTNECSLGYGKFVKCNNKPLVTTALDVKETVMIHCMSCIHHKSGDGGVDLVVLSPDDARIHTSESQDVPAEEAEGSGTEDATVSPGAEATTASAAEGTTVSGEATTVAGEESTVAGGEASTTGSSTEGTATTPEGSGGEVNGGTLGGEEGSGQLEKEGRGRISEVPLASGADGVEIPAGVNLEETAIGKVQVNGEKDEEGKFRPQLPTGFSIDSGLGKVQVDGKMPEGDKGAASGTVGGEEEKTETVTGKGVIGAGEGSTASPTETSTAEGTESSTGLTTGEEGTTAAGSSTAETPSESSTAGGESSSTPAGEGSSTTGHGTIQPAKEFEHTPLHPAGDEVEVGTAETTTGKGEEGEGSTSSSATDSGVTPSVDAETTTEEESPAFVQGSASEDDDEKEGLTIVNNDDLKHREGLVEKALATGKPTVAAGESTTGSAPTAAEAIDAEKTTVSGVEGEAGKSTVAPTGSESTTAAEPTTASSWDTPTGELDAMAATDGGDGEVASTMTPSESTTTDDVNDEAATTTGDLQHREGLLEKALATANPALTTKGGEEGSSSTPSSASTDSSASSTSEPTAESTVASSTEGTVAEGAESTVAASTEGTVATEESTVASSTEVTGGTVSPTVEGMAESIDEKTKEEAKEVEEEMAQKGEMKETGEKGAPAASLDTGSSTVAPSDVTGSTSSATDGSTTAVPSPADLAKSQHHEKGGAEFGQTGAKGTNEKEVDEEAAVKGEVKGSGAKGVSASSSLDASSTAAPSDTDGSTATESDAATGELTTASSVDGGVGGLAREGETESSTSSASETTAESTTGATDGSSTVASLDGESSTASSEGAESSTPSSDGSESSTAATSESHDDKEGILQKALANATPLLTEKGGVVSTTAVPSPADLAKSQHHEKGGAEFGQTGAKGTNEKEIAAQEDEIQSTTISGVEATTANGESIDGGIDSALSAIGEKTTTEPPVQAVKDLLDALASGDFDRALLGKKANGTEADQILKGKTQITEVATPINQKHEGQTFFEHDHNVDITTLHAIDDSIVTVPSPQGISKNCDGGRLEFQFVPAGSLPRLNVTNDVPARTPADCARKCHETKGCTTAGFIPTPSAEIANGVCLLTSDDEVCISRDDAVPQHASVTAFVISCIRCTRCSYTLSHMTLSSSTAKFQHISTVKTVGECAEVCNDKKCVFAQYDATTSTCALSMEASLESGCNKVEPSLAVKGAYPVRLECVQCKE